MTAQQQLDQAEQDGFDHLDRFDVTRDPAALRAAAEAWHWVAQSTSDAGQRSFVLAAVCVAMRRYYDATEELWALQDAISSARAAVQTERVPHRWLVASANLGIADYTNFQATGERSYLDEAIAVLRAAAHAADGENRGTILYHLSVALKLTEYSSNDEQFLVEAIEVGRQAARISGPLQMDSIIGLMYSLRALGGARDNLELLHEGEALGRWAARVVDDSVDRGRVLLALSQTLASIAEKTSDPAVMADAIATGEHAMKLTEDRAEYYMQNDAIERMRRQLQTITPRRSYPLPPM